MLNTNIKKRVLEEFTASPEWDEFLDAVLSNCNTARRDFALKPQTEEVEGESEELYRYGQFFNLPFASDADFAPQPQISIKPAFDLGSIFNICDANYLKQNNIQSTVFTFDRNDYTGYTSKLKYQVVAYYLGDYSIGETQSHTSSIFYTESTLFPKVATILGDYGDGFTAFEIEGSDNPQSQTWAANYVASVRGKVFQTSIAYGSLSQDTLSYGTKCIFSVERRFGNYDPSFVFKSVRQADCNDPSVGQLVLDAIPFAMLSENLHYTMSAYPLYMEFSSVDGSLISETSVLQINGSDRWKVEVPTLNQTLTGSWVKLDYNGYTNQYSCSGIGPAALTVKVDSPWGSSMGDERELLVPISSEHNRTLLLRVKQVFQYIKSTFLAFCEVFPPTNSTVAHSVSADIKTWCLVIDNNKVVSILDSSKKVTLISFVGLDFDAVENKYVYWGSKNRNINVKLLANSLEQDIAQQMVYASTNNADTAVPVLYKDIEMYLRTSVGGSNIHTFVFRFHFQLGVIPKVFEDDVEFEKDLNGVYVSEITARNHSLQLYLGSNTVFSIRGISSDGSWGFDSTNYLGNQPKSTSYIPEIPTNPSTVSSKRYNLYYSIPGKVTDRMFMNILQTPMSDEYALGPWSWNPVAIASPASYNPVVHYRILQTSQSGSYLQIGFTVVIKAGFGSSLNESSAYLDFLASNSVRVWALISTVNGYTWIPSNPLTLSNQEPYPISSDGTGTQSLSWSGEGNFATELVFKLMELWVCAADQRFNRSKVPISSTYAYKFASGEYTQGGSIGQIIFTTN